MRLTTFAVLPLIALSASVAVAQAPAKQTPPPGAAPKPFTLPASETFTLPNGLGVTLVPYGLVPKVTSSLVVDAGNVDERAQQIWLADLTGQLMKEGTATRPAAAVAEALGRMGGSLSIGVGPDQTTVTADVLSEFAPEAIAILADVVQRPALPASELPRLKADLARNVSLARSQPGGLAEERFAAALYPDHPYGRIFPTPAMIEGFSHDAVRKFHADHFGASRAHLYVVGRFDTGRVRQSVEQAFGSWHKGEPVSRSKATPVSTRSLHVVDRPGAPQSTVYIGGPVIDPSHPDYIALRVTNALLGGSFASRITANIREQKGYTYSPTSLLVARPKVAHWVETADVTTAVTGASMKEIFFEIDRLRREAPGEEELAGIRNYLAGVFVLQNSSRGGIIGQLSFTRLHGLGPDYLSTVVQKIQAVAAEDVRRIAETYLVPAKMTLVVVGDKAAISEQLQPYQTK